MQNELGTCMPELAARRAGFESEIHRRLAIETVSIREVFEI